MEPEILPPGADERRWRPRVFVAVSGARGERAYLAKPGVFSLILMLLVIGVVAGATLAFVLGLFLFWLPVIGLLAVGLLIGRLLTGRLTRIR